MVCRLASPCGRGLSEFIRTRRGGVRHYIGAQAACFLRARS